MKPAAPLGWGCAIGTGLGFATMGNFGTSVQSGAANTKGNWVLLGALPAGADADGFLMAVSRVVGSGTGFQLIEIGAGTSTTTVNTLVANYPARENTSLEAYSRTCVYMPVRLRGGTNVYARQQSSGGTGHSVTIGVHPMRGATGFPRGGAKVISMGATTGTSRGTAVVPAGSTAWTGWITVSASVPSDVAALLPVHVGTAGSMGAQRTAIDIASGAAGSEVPLAERIMWELRSSSGIYWGPGLQMPWIPAFVGRGQRLSVRAKNSAANANSAGDLVVLGMVP
jgi:hypothetical protein